MAFRKWMVRGIVFVIVALLAAGGFLYERLTNPAAIRREVIDKIGDHLIGVTVSLDSARFRLLGGITLTDLRLSRSDDPERVLFLEVPSGVIYHDKEQLREGRLEIRRIELHRPLLRIRKNADGRWNLAGILPPPELDKPKPTIVIQHGTVLLEDQPNLPPLEIKDVNLTLINDPIRSMVFRGAGLCYLLGKLQASGTYQRDTDEFEGSMQALDIPIREQLLKRLAPYREELGDLTGQLEAAGKLEAKLHYDRSSPRPWSYEVHAQVHDGALKHESIPLPLDAIQATFHCVDGQLTLEGLSATSGRTRLELQGKVLSLDSEADCEGRLKVTNLTVSAELFAKLPEGLRNLHSDYRPSGEVDVDVLARRKAGRWYRHSVARPRKMTATCDKFLYPLAHITGSLEQEIDPERKLDVLNIELMGLAGDRPIHIRGKIEGDKPAGVTVDIWGENLALDDKLMAALSPQHQKLARDFAPRGKVDFVASVRRAQGHTEMANRYLLRFHDAAVRYSIFPYPLEDVSGFLDILPDHWEFRDFRGSHKGCEVRSHGRSMRTEQGERLNITVEGTHVLLDEELESALQPGLKQAWQQLRPAGQIDFVARVDQLLSQREPELDVTVLPHSCSIDPTFFPYRLEEMTGTIRYAKQQVFLTSLKASHGPSEVTLHKGKLQLGPNGGVFVDLTDLEAHPLLPDEEFVRALPDAIESIFRLLELRDPMAVRTQIVVDLPAQGIDRPPVVYWNGGMAVRDASLRPGVQLDHVTGKFFCRGRYEGRIEAVQGNLDLGEATLFNQPFRNVQSHVEITKEDPNRIKFNNLKARIFGGDIAGQARIEYGPRPHYEIYLAASRIHLEELGRHNLMSNAEISGHAEARLYLEGTGAELDGLEGNGTVDVPNGRMYNLPLLLDLLKVPGLHAPDRTAFEEAHAKFSIDGERIHISQVDLYGNAISLSGQGGMDLDGTDIGLDFYALWGRAGLMLPPVIKEIPQFLSKNLLKVKMRGRIGEVRCTSEPLPVLLDPVKDFVNWVRQREARK